MPYRGRGLWWPPAWGLVGVRHREGRGGAIFRSTRTSHVIVALFPPSFFLETLFPPSIPSPTAARDLIAAAFIAATTHPLISVASSQQHRPVKATVRRRSTVTAPAMMQWMQC